MSNILHNLKTCFVCMTTYSPEDGEICRCPQPMYPPEEPRVVDWADPHFAERHQAEE